MLNQALLAGMAIDVRPFTGRQFNSCHIEETLNLIADEHSPEATGWERIQRDGRDFLRIDLRHIPTFILNCPEDRQKRLLMQEQLDELGMSYEFIRTMRITPGWVGVALGHLKVLRLSRARPPFLVLEDDCVFNPDFQAVIEVPADADCLYLSASLFGLEKPGQVSPGKVGKVFWSRHSTGYLRVYNMLARHALLYLDADFQQAVIASQVEALTNGHHSHPGDIGLSILQMTRTALLTEKSMCRQVNRKVTGGNLAELLPYNELADGRTINTDLPGSVPQNVQTAAPLGVGLISHKYRFIYCQIGKNASSTLRAELGKPFYACEPCVLGKLDEAILNGYFKFTFLRDPVSRLVSAYQEISMRHDMQDSTVRSRPFMQMEDGPERFEAFLDQLKTDKWDRHVYTQCSLLGNVPMDFYGRVESLAADLQTVFDRLGLGPCPELPRRRSRSSRRSHFGYERFNIDHQRLSPLQVSRIRAIYQEDVELILACCPVPPLYSGLPSSSQSHAPQIPQSDNSAAVGFFSQVNGQQEEWLVQLQLRGGAWHELKIPAGSTCLQQLRALLSQAQSSRSGQLLQLPLQQGRAVLTFSGSDVSFLSLAAASPQHHPLTMMDEGHLGGYLQSRHTRAAEYGTQHGDPATYTPELWQWLINTLGVRSMLDVGCGEGHAAAFFRDHGCAVLGVDGSVSAERDSVIAGLHQRHDYTLGPFVPVGSWDLVWSCEFVEHVEECYMENFLASFDCARKYLMMTYASPGQPGWHHVNCQPEDYWVEKLAGLGFRLDEQLTAQARTLAGAGHFQDRGLVFVRAEQRQAA